MDDSESEYGYSFLEISVGVYRSSTPEDVREMFEDAKREGVQLDPEEMKNEMKNAMHWNTIGIGKQGYYNEV